MNPELREWFPCDVRLRLQSNLTFLKLRKLPLPDLNNDNKLIEMYEYNHTFDFI